MSKFNSNVSLSMIRWSLDDIPVFPLPPGYTIRGFTPGDEAIWLAVQTAADRYHAITPKLYRAEFGAQPEILAQRQMFLIDPAGKGVGTATAWFDDNYRGRPFGRVHWVAIHPDAQGAGLSKPLMSKVCQTLRSLGHDKAYLKTSSARIPAIALYSRFGFCPEVGHEEEYEVWNALKPVIPGLRDFFHAISAF